MLILYVVTSMYITKILQKRNELSNKPWILILETTQHGGALET